MDANKGLGSGEKRGADDAAFDTTALPFCCRIGRCTRVPDTGGQGDLQEDKKMREGEKGAVAEFERK